MESDESDAESETPLPKATAKKKKQTIQTAEVLIEKKRTKDMIHEALGELKTRKGVSLYAIKKYITEKYRVDAEKINYLIKKQIKNGVIDGAIVQTKGVGAAGSFKLAPIKEKKKQGPLMQNENDKAVKEKKDAIKKKKEAVKNKPIPEDNKQKPVAPKEKIVKPRSKKTDENQLKITKANTKKSSKDKMAAGEAADAPKKKKTKSSKDAQTPAKKKSMLMRRKSIGNIIKPPKMKPKAHD